jgi:nucleoside 2-deoxyribosyltransferase
MGEVSVDVTITAPGVENKLRLGGIAHAARGFWALGKPFRAAAFLPTYLEAATRAYFRALGCTELTVLGTINGSPNVTLIFDPAETADQGYDSLLRDEKSIEYLKPDHGLTEATNVLIFPGKYCLKRACSALSPAAQLHLDVAYDLDTPDILSELRQDVQTIMISTSSPLFKSLPNQDLDGLIAAFNGCKPTAILLKENRGGSRLHLTKTSKTESLPAILGTTVNSVGVGDVFAAAYVANLNEGPMYSAWRAAYVSSAYAQTTDPDLFQTYVRRNLALTLKDVMELGGTNLPWDARHRFSIYLAAPDFSAGDRGSIDRALAALAYHNFHVRRPIVENGELPSDSDHGTLRITYQKDYELLKKCALVFAVPTSRDPGTLVEIGLAIEAGIPIVVYDPNRECTNTMVLAGSSTYSTDLDECLTAVFSLLGEKHAA